MQYTLIRDFVSRTMFTLACGVATASPFVSLFMWDWHWIAWGWAVALVLFVSRVAWDEAS